MKHSSPQLLKQYSIDKNDKDLLRSFHNGSLEPFGSSPFTIDDIMKVSQRSNDEKEEAKFAANPFLPRIERRRQARNEQDMQFTFATPGPQVKLAANFATINNQI